MPYISQQARKELEIRSPETPGELNYWIAEAVKKYRGKNPNYAKLNEIIGVLECNKLETYRRIVATYEDKKIQENGDVF